MTEVQRKLIDLIKVNGGKSVSFEVTPNMKEDQLNSVDVEPLFYSVTWHAKLHKCRSLDIEPLKLAIYLKKKEKSVLLHLSCDLLRKPFLDNLLLMLQKEGICDLFVILGDNYNPDTSDFKSSKELIIYIRDTTGDYFCIGVAGFPDREDTLKHLKEKIESGADFIITQAFFDVDMYARFLQKCKILDITVPILPGIFPCEKEKELVGFLNLCKVQHVTKELMEEIKSEPVDTFRSLFDKLMTDLKQNHVHFFTLDNLKRTFKIIRRE